MNAGHGELSATWDGEAGNYISNDEEEVNQERRKEKMRV